MFTLKQRRIHNVDQYLHPLPEGSSFQIALTNLDAHRLQLVRMGFSHELKVGERVLPRPLCPVSTFNADGLEVPQKDQAKETLYREAMIKAFGKKWVFVYIPYQRYPRITVPAPSEELTIEMRGEAKVVTARILQRHKSDPHQQETAKHQMNLFLESFGECSILSEALARIEQFEIERRNWRVLPTGEYPWETSKDILQGVTRSLSPSNRRLVDSRFRYLTTFNPTKLIIGQAGFDGYVVFCFEKSNVYVLESRFTNNATYVFGDEWEALSQLSKAEILNGHLHKHRLIHKRGWPERISSLLRNIQAA